MADWVSRGACLKDVSKWLEISIWTAQQECYWVYRAFSLKGKGAALLLVGVRKRVEAQGVPKLTLPEGSAHATRSYGSFLMSPMKPGSRPRADMKKILDVIHDHKAEEEVVIVGIRGYYKDTMGKPGVNDRGIYDDALFIVGPDHFSAYNGNTDPSGYRKGWGTSGSKGMANLKAGLWRAHKLGLHRGQYEALIQTGGKVTVIRDGAPNYEDTGWFGINIHRGGVGTTSSLGCQTIVPEQWPAFIANVKRLMNECDQKICPYILVEA